MNKISQSREGEKDLPGTGKMMGKGRGTEQQEGKLQHATFPAQVRKRKGVVVVAWRMTGMSPGEPCLTGECAVHCVREGRGVIKSALDTDHLDQCAEGICEESKTEGRKIGQLLLQLST